MAKEELSKSTAKIKAIEVVRFLVGIGIFVWLFWLAPKLAGQEIISALFGYVMLPFVFFSVPAAIIGLYFIITKKFRMRLDIILLLFAIFLLGNLWQFTISNQPPPEGAAVKESSILGDVKLEVKLVGENGEPISGVEVDLGKTPGPPPVGGSDETDENGIATFSVKPGRYVIYFNTLRFPKNLKQIGSLPIEVKEGEVNTKTIILYNK